jgi:DNA polymerase III subunit delta
MVSDSLDSVVTVIHGDNRLEIQERLGAVRERIDPNGLSTSVFDQPHSAIGELASAVGSPGFFGANRLVICHDLIKPSTGRRRSRSGAADEQALSALSEIAPGVYLLLIEESITKADEKRLRDRSPDITIEEVLTPRGRTLIDWICERARKRRSVIDGAAATRLAESLFPGTWRQVARRDDVPPDLYRLDTEIAKLSAAAGNGGEITGEMIAELVVNVDEQDMWGLSNAISDRDASRAVRQLEKALEDGQPPEMILGQLTAQFETLAVAISARSQPPAAVASRTGISEGRLRQASRSARSFTRSDVRRALIELRDFDFGVKQGLHEPEEALVSLVARLARQRR